MEKDYYKIIQEMKQERSQLDLRMQEDSNLLYLAKYILKDSAGKAVPDIINVTLNRPAVFAANVIASLGHAIQQCTVETDNEGVDTAYIEDFLKMVLKSADRRLMGDKKPLLNPFADTNFAVRGRHARRILLREKNGKFIPDIEPWDGRYVFYEQGPNPWAGYETTRLKRDVDAQYGEDASSKAVGELCTVIDVWDEDKNEIWIDGTLRKVQKNPYGVVPVVFQIVHLGYGPMLLDLGWEKREGESIFFMIRDIVPELNRLASILQTLNMNELKAALQYSNPQGTPQDEPPDRPAMGDVVSVGAGKIDVVKLGEARQAAIQMYGIIEKAFQEGSYTDIDIGNPRQPFSAVALMTIGESRDMVYLPRLAAKEQLNIATAEMIITQAMQIGGTIEVGYPGHTGEFDTNRLAGDYEITYRYTIKNEKTDVARMALAQQASAYYSRRQILDQILQDEDPDKTIMDRYAEMAEMIDPNVLRHRVIRSLLAKAEKGNQDAAREAKIMSVAMATSLMQTKMGQLPPPGKQPGAGQPSGNQPTQLPPLLGEGGNVGGLEQAVPGNPQYPPPA